jgi:hypothetical protein
MGFALKLVTPAGVDPVSAADAKARLRIDTTDEDADVLAAISAATELAQAECGRQFVLATYSLFLDAFPLSWESAAERDGYPSAAAPLWRGRPDPRAVVIPRPPLQSVTWVKYYDGSGALQTLSSAAYFVATAAEPGWLVPTYGTAWPLAQIGRPEAVEIRFVAGYTTLPPAAIEAIKVILADRWQNPEGGTGLPAAARRLLDTLETGEQW